MTWIQDPLPGLDEQLDLDSGRLSSENVTIIGGYLDELRAKRMRTWKEIARRNEETIGWGGL